ncbi:MAG: PEP-CTERM sorting domain-containing protein [Thermoguttaceae bacterium]
MAIEHRARASVKGRLLYGPSLRITFFLFFVLGIIAAQALADVWTGAGQSPVNQIRDWNLAGNWWAGAVPPAADQNYFSAWGEGTIQLNGNRWAGGMNFDIFSNTIIAPGAGPSSLNLVLPVAGLTSVISMGEGVRDTYGVDYFTAGPQFTADVKLNSPLTFYLGAAAGNGSDSAMMFSGQITSTMAGNTINYNGYGEGTGLWVTSNNSFAGGLNVTIVDGGGGADGSLTGYTLHLAQGTAATAGRLDQASITLSSDRCSLGLQDNTAATNTFVNHVDAHKGNIFADRSYQASDIQDTVINIKQNISNGVTLYDGMTFGGWPLYGQFGRTNNGFSVEVNSLNWVTTSPVVHNVGIRVENGNLTENRGGSRYVSGANRLQEPLNYAYIDMANEVAAVNFMEKDGPGVLAIKQVTGGGIANRWVMTNLLDSEGVLRLGAPGIAQAAPMGVDVRRDAALGFGWNTSINLTAGLHGLGIVPFTVIAGSAAAPGPGIWPGQIGAIDIDMWGHAGPIIDTNIVTGVGPMYMRVGSSMGGDASFDPHPLAAKHASTTATIYPCNTVGPPTYYLGGGGGTLDILSRLTNDAIMGATSLEMGTTGSLLPGRIALNPAIGSNTYSGSTDIYAGTLQLIAQNSVKMSSAINVSTYNGAIWNGLYANPGMPFGSWNGPGQLLLDPGMMGPPADHNWDIDWYTANGGAPMSAVLWLNGGVVGWTSDVTLLGPPGMYARTFGSNLNPAAPTVYVLGLGGEYSAGTMTVMAPIMDNWGGGPAPTPVLLYKAGKNSKLDLSPPRPMNTFTGGTIIAGGEIIVNDANQLNAQFGGTGGPIAILNGGRLHIIGGMPMLDTNFCVPIKVNTSGTPDTVKNCGSVIEVDAGVTASLKANFDFSWNPTAYLEKDGQGELDYVATAPAAPLPGMDLSSNAWGLKLTAGLVKVNQMPVNPGADPAFPGADSGPVIFNNGNLEVTQVPAGMTWDTNPAYGFRNIVSFEGTGNSVVAAQNTITVEDNAMFRTHGIVPNEILGTVHFVASDLDANAMNNVVHLSRNMAPAGAASTPADLSHGNGKMTFQGVTVYMSGGGMTNDLNVLPREAGFTLELDDGVVFNASTQNSLYGAVIFNNTNPGTPIRIDGEEASSTPVLPPPFYQFTLATATWGILGTGLTAWSGKTEKIGAGIVLISRDNGAPVTVNAGAMLQISGGTFQAGGDADPFTDNTLTPGLSMDIVNNSTATGLLISQGVKNVGDISGTGNTTVNGPSGTELIVDSIAQNTLTIGAGCVVTIRAIPGGPFASGANLTPVPEPATWLLLALAAAGMMGWRASRLYKSGS